MNIAVFGLGKLGLCSAACFAAQGHQVVGFDKNADIMAALAAGRCPIQETALEELLQQARRNFRVTDDVASMVREADLSVIIVPTPSQADGRFSNSYVEDVLQVIGPALAQRQGFHVVDVVSTVMPGSSDQVFKPLLERLSGKVCGRDFGLAYNPEFIALGSILENFLNPDLVLIGASDQRSGALVEEVYRQTCKNAPTFAVMSLVNAEITKISLNCFVTMKISFANELAALCERVPGADVDVITAALGADTRIGKKYLTGGLGFGGPCFPRDNLAFQAFAAGTGYRAHLGPQVVQINTAVVDRLTQFIRQQAETGERIALMGLSYKPHTHIIEESQSVMLARRLVGEGYGVAVHDPQALYSTREELGDKVDYCPDPYACVTGAAVVMLLTNWPNFADLDWERIGSLVQPGAVVCDSWRILKGKDLNGCRYHGIGLGQGKSMAGGQ